MVGTARLLNSEIDDLARVVGGETLFLGSEEHPDFLRRGFKRSNLTEQEAIDEAYVLIRVLAKKWPTVCVQVEYEIRKMIAELGLNEY